MGKVIFIFLSIVWFSIANADIYGVMERHRTDYNLDAGYDPISWVKWDEQNQRWESIADLAFDSRWSAENYDITLSDDSERAYVRFHHSYYDGDVQLEELHMILDVQTGIVLNSEIVTVNNDSVYDTQTDETGSVINVEATVSPSIASTLNPELSVQIDANTNDIQTNEQNITTISTDVSSIQTQMTTAETDINSLETKMSTAETDINSLETQMSDVENVISDGSDAVFLMGEDVQSNKQDISNNQEAISSNETEIETNQENIESNRTTIASNTSSIVQIQSTLSNTQDVSSLNELIANNKQSISRNSSDISDNKSGVAMAMAMEPVFFYPEEKLVLSLGASSFKGTQAFSLNSGFRLDDRVHINASVAYDTSNNLSAQKISVRFGW